MPLQSLVDDIARRCRDFRDDPVVADGNMIMSGAEFIDRATRLKHDLGNLGVGPGTRVGLRLPIGADLLVAIVATWLSEASFVPINPLEAPTRLAHIVADGQVTTVLEAAVSALAHPGNVGRSEISTVGIVGSDIRHTHGNLTRPALSHSFADEAYVIFTSGSTGKPKGVSVGHEAIAAYTAEALRVYEVPVSAMAFPVSLPPTFDAALTSLIPPLITRNVAYCAPTGLLSRQKLAAFLTRCNQPVFVKITPTQLRLLSSLLDAAVVERLSGVFVIGGEPLHFEDLVGLRRAPGLKIFNEYGPTEATVGCAMRRVELDDPPTGPVPIGRPHGAAAFRVNEQSELIIAGPCVANGYVVDDDNEAFSIMNKRRSYRTGDMVRRDVAGDYHFLGRADGQVKVNGYRVELGEVEAALRRVKGVHDAAAVAVGGALVGFAVAPRLDPASVRAELAAHLPDYMTPAEVCLVGSIPLTDHGKVDRDRLTELLNGANAKESASDGAKTTGANSVDLTAIVAKLWCDLLDLERISDETDFFATGDSIAALKLTGRLSASVGSEIPISLVFDYPSFPGFVAAVKDHLAGGTVPSATSGRMLAPSQVAILDAERWASKEGMYTVVDAVRVTGVGEWTAVEPAVAGVLTSHDVFAWRIRSSPELHAAVCAGGAPRIVSVDLRSMTAAEADAVIAARLKVERARRIDLSDGAVPGALLFRTATPGPGQHEGVCAIVAHHAVIDEISMGLLWKAIFGRVSGGGATVGIDHRFASWAQDRAQPTAKHRSRTLADEIADRLHAAPIGSLPSTAPHYAVTDHHQSPVSFSLAASRSERCAETAKTLRLPISAVYGAVVVRALATLIGAPRFVIFMPMTCRRTAADFDTVGCYTTNLPVLAELPRVAETPAAAVVRWQRSVSFTSQRAEADPAHLQNRMRSDAPGWFVSPRVSLSIETPQAGRAGSIAWSSFPIAGGPAKDDLSIFVTAVRGTPAFGRIAWRATLDGIAQAFIDGLEEALDAICGSDGIQAIPEADVGRAAAHDPVAIVPASANSTDLATRIAERVARLLQQPVAIGDDLLAAGATSRHLVALIAEIQACFGVLLRPVDLFDHPTPAELAAIIAARVG